MWESLIFFFIKYCVIDSLKYFFSKDEFPPAVRECLQVDCRGCIYEDFYRLAFWIFLLLVLPSYSLKKREQRMGMYEKYFYVE